MKCQHCGKEITRKRGNLNFQTLKNAIRAQLLKHEAKCLATSLKMPANVAAIYHGDIDGDSNY